MDIHINNINDIQINVNQLKIKMSGNFSDIIKAYAKSLFSGGNYRESIFEISKFIERDPWDCSSILYDNMPKINN